MQTRQQYIIISLLDVYANLRIAESVSIYVVSFERLVRGIVADAYICEPVA